MHAHWGNMLCPSHIIICILPVLQLLPMVKSTHGQHTVNTRLMCWDAPHSLALLSIPIHTNPC